ncbi:MAG: hypothetical protein ABSC32_10645 [Steroidobacteraceae bacterium]
MARIALSIDIFRLKLASGRPWIGMEGMQPRSPRIYGNYPGLAVAAMLVVWCRPVMVFADQESDVAALEAQCEAEREAKIKPLRDMEIAKCKADQHNDPAYCERFWKDYGNSIRAADGVMVPRMFGELPVCVAAFKARKALADGDVP